ncbi:MAG: alpha/beta fold hydrolase [Erysipelotrichaceae bacterium]|nr:alpha/beta fold hydrolase [Erysipelotrichaceae bacterium]
MKKNKNVFVIICLCLLVVATILMAVANNIQKDNGNIQIVDGQIGDGGSYLTFKLYKPVDASAQNKAPAVLLLHGYQNDHETCAAYAIELARRGAVVLCLDEYGHGASNIGLLNRGYVNHVVKVNYGNDSVEDGTFKSIGGSKRYRVLMNFSNLSFFKDYYSKDDAGNQIIDSSCGGTLAYDYLSKLDYVDNSRMAVSGHSMGTWSSWTVAADYSGTPIAPKAIVLQCGELFTKDVYDNAIKFNNVLLLQAKYDEFSYFRDYEKTVGDNLLKSDLRTSFLNTTANKAEWNKTYGSFNDGSARRMELLYTNHRLTTHNLKGLEVALDWFDEAIDLPKDIAHNNITAKTKEYLVLCAMLLVLASLFPLLAFLLELPVFKDVRQQLPDKDSMVSKKGFTKGALITILISGASFPFMTQLGHALLPLPEGIFRMTVGNGFLGWYLLLIIVMLITSYITNRSNKKKGIETEKFNLNIFLKSFLLAAVMIVCMYIVNMIYSRIFDLDLRFIWPFFREFTLERFGQFLVYLPVFGLFYYLNNTKIMRDLRTDATYEKGAGAFVKNWLINFLLMAGGVLIVVLIEYIPFFANIGPGADLLFGSTFGGPFMSILILFVPQVMFFSILCTYAYRMTGRAYTGAILAAMLACWIVTGGSSIL